MLSAVTRSATFLSASCSLFSPHWIGKTKDCFRPCVAMRVIHLTLHSVCSWLCRWTKYKKLVSIIFFHFQMKWKKCARWTPRSKTPVVGWGRKLPLSLTQLHAMKHTRVWGYCFFQSWHYVKVTCQLHVPPALPPKNALPITMKQIAG